MEESARVQDETKAIQKMRDLVDAQSEDTLRRANEIIDSAVYATDDDVIDAFKTNIIK